MDSSGNFLPVPATPSKDIAFHFGQDTVIPKSPTTPLRRRQSLRASNTVFDREVSKIWEETPVSPTHDPKLEAVTNSFGDVKLNEGEKRHFLSPKQVKKACLMSFLCSKMAGISDVFSFRMKFNLKK